MKGVFWNGRSATASNAPHVAMERQSRSCSRHEGPRDDAARLDRRASFTPGLIARISGSSTLGHRLAWGTIGPGAPFGPPWEPWARSRARAMGYTLPMHGIPAWGAARREPRPVSAQ